MLAEVAGGYINRANKAKQDPSDPSIDADGRYGLSRHNDHNIVQGYSDGLAASGSPAPFSGYGYGTQPAPPPNQIGDGNGIADWLTSLSGVDPDEPTPPAWPPGADRPIRYLGRRTQ
jgi:hypothetical protein